MPSVYESAVVQVVQLCAEAAEGPPACQLHPPPCSRTFAAENIVPGSWPHSASFDAQHMDNEHRHKLTPLHFISAWNVWLLRTRFEFAPALQLATWCQSRGISEAASAIHTGVQREPNPHTPTSPSRHAPPQSMRCSRQEHSCMPALFQQYKGHGMSASALRIVGR
jgi:hypothetical protein